MATSKAKKTVKVAKTAAKGAARVGRGTRWTDEQVKLLLDSVKASRTAKEGFEQAAKQLGKNVGTVQQKYYNLQKQVSGGAVRRRGSARRAGAAATTPRAASGRAATLPSAADLRVIPVDDLVALAQRVKGEVDRRRQELGAAAQLFK